MGKFWFYIVLALSAVLWSCQEKKPSRADEYLESVRRNDSIELDNARLKVADAERDVLRLTKLVEDFKGRFVFEKVEKYQTMGYWVLPAYKGSKERFTFFPEVEESGKMLLVNIDGKRRYTFTEVDLDSEDYEQLLLKGLSLQQRKDVGECYAFAKTMKQLKEAREQQERMALKVRFYEEKIRRRENDSTYIH